VTRLCDGVFSRSSAMAEHSFTGFTAAACAASLGHSCGSVSWHPRVIVEVGTVCWGHVPDSG
jgi:hypothetical protein